VMPRISPDRSGATLGIRKRGMKRPPDLPVYQSGPTGATWRNVLPPSLASKGRTSHGACDDRSTAYDVRHEAVR
jgi:hypothetical protein